MTTAVWSSQNWILSVVVAAVEGGAGLGVVCRMVETETAPLAVWVKGV